jgi:Rrf2 family iron-sulfur cluster assembly transcriptional regulator
MRLSLSRQADHAVRAMVWLAERPPGDRRKAAEIAEAVEIPRAFAARVLARLNGAGLLDGRAGYLGGYALARPAAAISLLDVIEAIEGPLRARSCLLRDAPCGTGDDCPMHTAWRTSQDALRDVLAATAIVPADTGSRATTRVA